MDINKETEKALQKVRIIEAITTLTKLIDEEKDLSETHLSWSDDHPLIRTKKERVEELQEYQHELKEAFQKL